MQSPTVNQEDLQLRIGQKLIQIIRIILCTEREAEELKITLAENIRFDISDAFRAIDANMKGYITNQDIFRFMSKNGYSVQLKFCNFYIYIWSKGDDKLTYQHFLEFIVPRYDKDAAMQCIVRKLYSEAGKYKLSFYLEEFVAKLIFKELEYLKLIEVEKMNLAQMVEWKFTTVFKYVAGNLPVVDKRCLDSLLNKFDIQPLTQQDYNMFLKRFNRNEDTVLQRDEFSDAIFPSGELMKEMQPKKDGFNEYVINQDQQLDQFLGREQIKDDDDFVFKPEDHKISTQQKEELVKDKEMRKYLSEDPQLSVSHFVPIQPHNNQLRIGMSFKPTQQIQPQNLSPVDFSGNIKESQKSATPIKKSKQYQSPFEQASQVQQQDLLMQFERKNVSQQPISQDNISGYNYLNQNLSIEQSQQLQYNQYINQPTNAQYILSRQ